MHQLHRKELDACYSGNSRLHMVLDQPRHLACFPSENIIQRGLDSEHLNRRIGLQGVEEGGGSGLGWVEVRHGKVFGTARKGDRTQLRCKLAYPAGSPCQIMKDLTSWRAICRLSLRSQRQVRAGNATHGITGSDEVGTARVCSDAPLQ